MNFAFYILTAVFIQLFKLADYKRWGEGDPTEVVNKPTPLIDRENKTRKQNRTQ